LLFTPPLSEPASEQEEKSMTHKRTWLALAALLTAIVGGTVWAAEQAKKTADTAQVPDCCEREPHGIVEQRCITVEKKPTCCEEKCSQEKTCCEGKCCTKAKAKSCCADGKCCGCCEKGKGPQAVTLPIPPGSVCELMISPAGFGPPDSGCYMERVCPPPCVIPPAPSQPTLAPSYVPVTQYVPAPCIAPPACAPSCPAVGWGTTGRDDAPSRPSVTIGASTGMSSAMNRGATCDPPLTPPAPSSVAFGCGTTGVRSPDGDPMLVRPNPGLPPVPVQPVVSVSPWRIRAVSDKDHAGLEMHFTAAGEDTCACCDGMTLKVGSESLKLAVADKQVQVSGSFIKGSADTIARNTIDGSICLEGHVKLKYEKAGQKAEVSAERVVVGVADGRLEVKPVEPQPQQQAFSFWNSFFR
jgi:hypothetical protein